MIPPLQFVPSDHLRPFRKDGMRRTRYQRGSYVNEYRGTSAILLAYPSYSEMLAPSHLALHLSLICKGFTDIGDCYNGLVSLQSQMCLSLADICLVTAGMLYTVDSEPWCSTFNGSVKPATVRLQVRQGVSE